MANLCPKIINFDALDFSEWHLLSCDTQCRSTVKSISACSPKEFDFTGKVECIT